MCEELNHEVEPYKSHRWWSTRAVQSDFIYRMAYSTATLLSSVLLLLAIVQAQEYFFEQHGTEPKGRTRRDAAESTLNAEEPWENVRFRRDDEMARHRRQGGHGGGGGGGGGHEGITGPVHTFVKTDEHAHFKWGVRHHVGHEYAGRR